MIPSDFSPPRAVEEKSTGEPPARVVASPAPPGEPTIDPKHIHVRHLDVLDGWRGISIAFVLFAHLAPLGYEGNLSVGLVGMAIFFVLSGFLITSFLLRADATLWIFVIRRVVRIVPLAWLYLAVVFLFQRESVSAWIAHFLFYANLPPPSIRLATDHLWSLCVEMQFYVGIALLYAFLRQRGLKLLPVIAVAITFLRVIDNVYASSVTWYRIDEILAGATLALALNGRLGVATATVERALGALPQWGIGALFLASCWLAASPVEWLNYLRPYLAALLVGATLCRPSSPLGSALHHRWLRYLATVSYAIYVFHLGLTYTWLGSGDLFEKYAKRPLLLIVLFALAHVSTFYYERPFINLGKKVASRFARVRLAYRS